MSERAEDQGIALVVDDDPTLRLLTRQALEGVGFTVVEAANGLAGIEAVAHYDPSLIIMDVEMPRMNGFEACAAIRKMPGFSDTPIVMATALGDAGSIDRAYECGATDFIPKPVNWPILRHRVRYLMRAGSIRQSLRTSEAKNRAFVQAIPDSMLVVNRAGVLVDLHHGQQGQLFLEQALVKGEDVMTAIPKELAELWSDQIEAVLTTASTETLEFGLNRGGIQRHFDSRMVPYTSDEVLIIIRDITQQKLAIERVRKLAFFDTLTELPNRQSFLEQLSNAIRGARLADTRLAVIYIDLDNFKRINDSLGHSVGDELLKLVAKRLDDYVRSDPYVLREGRSPNDIQLARLGGDEFTIILRGVAGSREAEDVADRLRVSLGERLIYGGHHYVITPSMGIAMYPEHGTDVDSLVKSADVAMYSAKARGGDGQCPFTETMSLGSVEKLDLEDALRRSVANGDLELHYQPKIALADESVSGFEALVRWTHPELGPISPARFVPIAEEAGLISDLSDWVLDEACRQIREWENGPLAGIPVAVNLSSVQFNRGDVFHKVTERLRHHSVKPGLLHLELTESILMQDADGTAAVLSQLKEAGLSLAVDDFGTGYSSLNYLKKFPLDALKIDQSFVAGVGKSADDKSICAAVIALAHALSLKVVGEGVESNDQLEVLRDLGCDEIQGYLYARPMPAADVPGFVREHGAGASETGLRQNAG